MKKTYIKLLVLASALPLQGVMAQKDTTMNRELLLEKQYNPVIRDADKITSLPDVDSIKVTKSKAVYSKTNSVVNPSPQIVALESANVKTYYEFSNKHGYLDLGAGNYANIDAAVGYRMVDTDADLFGFNFLHRSTSGTLDYVDYEGDVKQKFNQEHFNLYYDHNFDMYRIASAFTYEFTGLNFYGYNNFWSGSENNLDKQKHNRIDLSVHLDPTGEQELKFRGGAALKVFTNNIPDFSETGLDFDFGIEKTISETESLDGYISLNSLVYNKVGDDNYFWSTENPLIYDYSIDGALNDFSGIKYKNAGVLSLVPSYKYTNNEGFRTSLGLKMEVGFGVKPNFVVAPNITLDYMVSERSQMYVSLLGGINQYSFNEATRLCPYFAGTQPQNGHTLVEFNIGMKSASSSNFWYDIYASAANVKDMRYFYSSIIGVRSQQQLDGQLAQDVKAINCQAAGNEDAITGRVGANLKYTKDDLSIEARLQLNGYSSEFARSGRSGVDLRLAASYRPIKPLLVQAQYNLAAKRKAYTEILSTLNTTTTGGTPTTTIYGNSFEMVELKAVSDLALKGTYTFNDWISANLSINNVFCQKYDIWYGMPAQSINFRLGATLHF